MHRGLPEDTPWFFRVVLRSRGFLIVTFVITVSVAVIAASNPEWLLRIDQPVSEWVRGWGGQQSFAKLVTRLGSPTLAVTVGVVAVAVLWRRCRDYTRHVSPRSGCRVSLRRWALDSPCGSPLGANRQSTERLSLCSVFSLR